MESGGAWAGTWTPVRSPTAVPASHSTQRTAHTRNCIAACITCRLGARRSHRQPGCSHLPLQRRLAAFGRGSIISKHGDRRLRNQQRCRLRGHLRLRLSTKSVVHGVQRGVAGATTSTGSAATGACEAAGPASGAPGHSAPRASRPLEALRWSGQRHADALPDRQDALVLRQALRLARPRGHERRRQRRRG